MGHFELGHLDRARVELEASRQLVADGGESGAGFHPCRPGTAAGPRTHRPLPGRRESGRRHAGEGSAHVRQRARHGGRALRERLAAFRGDAVKASKDGKACAEIGAENPAYGAMARLLGGWAPAVQGDPAGATVTDEAFADYIGDGTLMHVPVFLVLLAEAHVCTGDPLGARSLVAQARSVASITNEDCLGPRLSQPADDLERCLTRAAAQ